MGDQAKIGALVLACLEKKVIKGEDVVEALNAVLGEVEELQMDIPKVGVIAATFCGQFLAVEGELASLSSGFETLKDSNKAVKTLLLTLNVIKEIKTEDFARECFSSSAIDFKTLVADYIPAEEADAEVADNINSAKADWLMPLLGAEEYLRTSYGNGTASAEMVGWVQEHVAAGLIQDAKFAHIMMRALPITQSLKRMFLLSSSMQACSKHSSKQKMKCYQSTSCNRKRCFLKCSCSAMSATSVKNVS